MTRSTKYLVGINILVILAIFKNNTITSEYLARKLNVHPAVVRRIVGMLKKHSLVKVYPGVAGTELTKDPSEITLLDVYRAVNTMKVQELFSLNNVYPPDFAVGPSLKNSLTIYFNDAEKALENSLDSVSIKDIVQDVLQQRGFFEEKTTLKQDS